MKLNKKTHYLLLGLSFVFLTFSLMVWIHGEIFLQLIGLRKFIDELFGAKQVSSHYFNKWAHNRFSDLILYPTLLIDFCITNFVNFICLLPIVFSLQRNKVSILRFIIFIILVSSLPLFLTYIANYGTFSNFLEHGAQFLISYNYHFTKTLLIPIIACFLIRALVLISKKQIKIGILIILFFIALVIFMNYFFMLPLSSKY